MNTQSALTFLRRMGCTAATAIFLLGASSTNAADPLIDILIKKGILTQDEAAAVKKEVELEGGPKLEFNKGVKKITFGGDFRARYDGVYRNDSRYVDRQRYRYRFRAGVKMQLNDNLETGFRFGSGEFNPVGLVNPITLNQSFRDNGASKPLFIDLAYGKWSPLKNERTRVDLTVGKLKNPFDFSNLLFDGDYNPEGTTQTITHKLSERHSLYGALGQFVLDELSGSNKDPFLLGSEVRLKSKWSDKIETSTAAAFFSFQRPESLTSGAVPNVNVGNTRDATGALTEEFNTFVLDASATYYLESFPFYEGRFPLKATVEYANNTAAANANKGYSIAFKMGKAGKKGLWQASYTYRELQNDFWYEELVDSNFGGFYNVAPLNSGVGAGYRDGTGHRGHTFVGRYSFSDSLYLDVTYFLSSVIDENPAGSGSLIGRVMADIIWSF